MIAVVIVIGLSLAAIANSNNSFTSNNLNSTYNTPTNTDSYSADLVPIDTTTGILTDDCQQPNESEYKGNQLRMVFHLLDHCFGKDLYGGNVTLTIINGAGCDAIVCYIYNVERERTIRSEYV